MAKKAQSTVTTRPAMERLLQIHRLLQNEEYPNCTKLAAEFEMTVRTLKRDMYFLKERLNLPVAFNVQRNGYYYTRPVSHFPQTPMTENEVFTLLVANKAIAQYHGTPFQRVLEATFRKLTGQLDQSVRFSLGSLGEVLSFRPFAPGDTDLKMFETLTRAVSERRVVKFLYRNRGQLKTEQRRVHPYHIACVDNQWCLFGFDLKRQGLRTFVLSRLSKPALAGGRFTVSKRFDLNEFLRGSLGVYEGKDDYEVVIELDAWAADDVRGRRLHPSQELTELPNGVLRLRLRLNSIEEAEKWVLSLGTHAMVIRPLALAERVAKTSEALAARYAAAAADEKVQSPRS